MTTDQIGAVRPPFTETYGEARTLFLEAAARAGARVCEYANPVRGPQGEALFASVAVLGADTARRAVVTISGVHGIEGFAGSACQIDWMRRGLPQAPDLACVHIHAINPYGFAALSRVDENNVDINRNFRSEEAPAPSAEGYAGLTHALTSSSWDPRRRDAATRILDAYHEAHGRAAWQAAVMGGQYLDADGLFYGGVAPCWSNRTLKAIVADHLEAFESLTVVDFHTGLGRYGEMELMAISPPESPGFAQLRGWLGEAVTSPYANTANAQRVEGPLLAALPDALPRAELALLAIEFGTVDTPFVVEALRADNWARRYARPSDPAWREVKRMMRARFCPRSPDWERRVLDGARLLAARLSAGLSTVARTQRRRPLREPKIKGV